MDQVLAIEKVRKKIKSAIEAGKYNDPSFALAILKEIDSDLEIFLENGIDFKDVVDALDDSIFITDKDSKVLYVNPAYKVNTQIEPDEVIGRRVVDIVKEGTLFTGGATLDVIKSKNKAFRLSTVTKTDPPGVGYAVGVPIFNEQGELHQVVVSSRPILSLSALHEDFGRFLNEANSIKKEKENISIIDDYEKIQNEAGKLVGSSYSLQKVYKTIMQAGPTDATVLITGESGVGKEIIADELYRLSKRKDKTFIKVNCASIPLNLLESELFGYEKGAFSGANSTGKQGIFEMANGGTLLLDEIGDMPMDLQVKLLRAIQNQEITKVGGTKPIKLDIRFIAATNCDLKQRIAEGTFRQDLYYRLNVIPIYMPPLRERLNDIDELANHFVEMYTNRHGREFVLTEDQLFIMKQYSWPGNIRELENVIEYLTICSSGSSEGDIEILKGLLDVSHNVDVQVADHTLSESLETYEKNLIESVLKTSKNLRDAGNKLGVNASTISRKIKQYGINYPNSADNKSTLKEI